MRAVANRGWSRYAALTGQAEEPLSVNESIHGEKTASEPHDQLTELIEQQTAISEVACGALTRRSATRFLIARFTDVCSDR